MAALRILAVIAALPSASAAGHSMRAVHTRFVSESVSECDRHNATTDADGKANTTRTPIFQLLLKDWKEVPDLGKFSERCTKLVEKLLPKMRCEYTALRVPDVLLNDCDVYATKSDYKTNNTEMEDARSQCRYSAIRLGEEFMGKKPDYKKWCGSVHAYLTEQQNLHIEKAKKEQLQHETEMLKKQLEDLRIQYEEMRTKKGQITEQLEAMGKEVLSKASLPCCPDTCRQCPAEPAGKNASASK